MSELVKALCEAHKKLPPLSRSKTVNTGKYEYSYCPLDEQISLTKNILADHGLAIVQCLTSEGGALGLSTSLRHVGGETIQSWMPLPASVVTGGRPQELGSVVSYYRRYARQAILDQCAEEDADGDAPGTVKVSERASRHMSPASKFILAIADANTQAQLDAVAKEIKAHKGTNGQAITLEQKAALTAAWAARREKLRTIDERAIRAQEAAEAADAEAEATAAQYDE